MPAHNIDWANDARDPFSFLCQWSGYVAAALNGQFTPGETRFVAEVACRSRVQNEEEIASFHIRATAEGARPAFEPAEPTLVAPARFIDGAGVEVIETREGRRVAAAVLFATPDNKVDSDAALAFAVRVAGLLGTGAGVVVVDALPGPPAWATHLHSLTGVYPLARRPRGSEATVLVVQPEILGGASSFAVWLHALASGFPLPTVSLPVRGAAYLTLDLEATYLEACERGRIA